MMRLEGTQRALAAGETLSDRYVLEACVGAGSMGEVWRAKDGSLGVTVALKVLPPVALVSASMVLAVLMHGCRSTPTLTDRLAAAQREVASLQRERDGAEADVARLRGLLASSQEAASRATGLEDKATRLGTELEAATAEAAELKSRLATTQQSAAKLEGQVARLRIERDDAKAEVSRLRSQVASTPPWLASRRVAGDLATLDASGIKVEMKWIPSGTFAMGSPEDEPGHDNDEGPQRPVTLSGFWLMEHEVTQGQYQALMGRNPSRFKEGADAANRPVERVTWYDSIEFCNRLTKAANVANLGWNLTECYRISGIERDLEGRITSAEVSWLPGTTGFRLPTEAEWEYACRAGTTTAYSFGDDVGSLGDYAWYPLNSGDRSHAVKEKRANGWGLYDMHGNVWEWCADWYRGYPSSPVTDPRGPTRGRYRVMRGGAWVGIGSPLPEAIHGRMSRSAYRFPYAPGRGDDSFGFRVAMPPRLPY